MTGTYPTIGELYVDVFRNFSDELAIVDGKRRITYGELRDWVARIITAFDQAGLHAGDLVGLALDMSAEYLAHYLAAQISGVGTVDLPPHMPVEDLCTRISQASIKYVVMPPSGADGETGQAVLATGAIVLALGHSSRAIDFSRAVRDAASSTIVARTNPGAAVIAYTSGSTGAPKAAAFSHTAPAAQALMLMATLTYPARPVAVLCFGHFTIMAMQMIPTLIRGGTIVTRPDFDLKAMIEVAQAERANLLFLPTQYLYLLLERDDTTWMKGQIELFFYGGESMTSARLQELTTRFGPVFAQAYGAMEAGPAAVLLPEDHDPAEPDKLASMGRPMVGTRIEIRDAAGAALPAGEIGRIAVKSGVAMDCYVGLPEKTREVLIDGWLYNGDVGYRDQQGYLQLVDRSSFAIERNGITYYPRAIEACLGEHINVRGAAVLQIDSDGRNALCAGLLLHPEVSLNLSEINEHLDHKLGLTLDFVLVLDALPLNSLSRKLDRPRLQELLKSELGATRA